MDHIKEFVASMDEWMQDIYFPTTGNVDVVAVTHKNSATASENISGHDIHGPGDSAGINERTFNVGADESYGGLRKTITTTCGFSTHDMKLNSKSVQPQDFSNNPGMLPPSCTNLPDLVSSPVLLDNPAFANPPIEFVKGPIEEFVASMDEWIRDIYFPKTDNVDVVAAAHTKSANVSENIFGHVIHGPEDCTGVNGKTFNVGADANCGGLREMITTKDGCSTQDMRLNTDIVQPQDFSNNPGMLPPPSTNPSDLVTPPVLLHNPAFANPPVQNDNDNSLNGGGDTSEEDELVYNKSRRTETYTPEMEASRIMNGAKVVIRTESEVDIIEDGFLWRKYGKYGKKDHNSRSYYKCTTDGCNARKYVERSSSDPKFVITAYEGMHKHGITAPSTTIHLSPEFFHNPSSQTSGDTSYQLGS